MKGWEVIHINIKLRNWFTCSALLAIAKQDNIRTFHVSLLVAMPVIVEGELEIHRKDACTASSNKRTANKANVTKNQTSSTLWSWLCAYIVPEILAPNVVESTCAINHKVFVMIFEHYHYNGLWKVN